MRDAGTAAYLQTYRQAAQQRRNISFNPNFPPPKQKLSLLSWTPLSQGFNLNLNCLNDPLLLDQQELTRAQHEPTQAQ